MKFLVHAINGVGLGHVMRTKRIADAVKCLRADADVVFVTNSQCPEILQTDYKVYVLKKNTGGVVEGEYSYDEYMKYNVMALKKIILHERPDAAVFDCEFSKDILLFCQDARIKTIFVLRNTTAERFKEIKTQLMLFDSIIVPHAEEDVIPEQKAFLTGLSAVFTGPIADPQNDPKGYTRKNILITFGAGAMIHLNRPLFSAVDSFLDAVRNNSSWLTGHGVGVDIITGPLYQGGCNLTGFTVRTTTTSLMGEMYTAKVVISGAGYNTVNEIILTKTPAVLVPLARGWDDQYQRATTLAALGCVQSATTGIFKVTDTVLKKWDQYHCKFPSIEIGNKKAAEVLVEIAEL